MTDTKGELKTNFTSQTLFTKNSKNVHLFFILLYKKMAITRNSKFTA